MKFADSVKQTANLASTATITLGAAAVGFRTWAQAIADTAGKPEQVTVGDTVCMRVDDATDASKWEIADYTIGGTAQAPTLTRVTIRTSSAGGTTPVVFGGPVTVLCTAPASYLAGLLSAANGVTLAGLTAASSLSGSTVFECSNDGGTTSLLTTLTQIAAAVASINGASSSGASSIATAITLSGPTSGTVSVASSNFTVGVSPVGGAISGTITVTPSDNGGGGSFSPTSVALTSAAPTATFKYTPSATAGARTISVTNSAALTAPASITYTSSAAAGAAATAIAVSGPTSGTVSVASTNFTASANGTITGTVVITPSDGGAGGTFTPTTVSISSGTPTATFTYTPNATAGAKTLSFTNNGSLSNPANITYTASAAASGGTQIYNVYIAAPGSVTTPVPASTAVAPINTTLAAQSSNTFGGVIAFDPNVGISGDYVVTTPFATTGIGGGWGPSGTVAPTGTAWTDPNGYSADLTLLAYTPDGKGKVYQVGLHMGVPAQVGTYNRYPWINIDGEWHSLCPNNPCVITISS